MTIANQIQYPKMSIEGPDTNGSTNFYVADVDSTDHLLTGGGTGIAILKMGPRSMIVGPSGFIANVDSNGNLSTTNG
jgi:hypothetical protein